MTWDLRHPAPDPVDLSTPGFSPPWVTPPEGPLVAPGSYRVELALVSSAGVESLGEPQAFEVKPVPTAPDGTDFNAVAAFQLEASDLMRRVSAAGQQMGEVSERLRHMRAALVETPGADASLFNRLDEVGASLTALRTRLNGDPIRGQLNEASSPSVRGRVGLVTNGHWGTRQMPTQTQRSNLEIASGDFATLSQELSALMEGPLAQLESDLAAAGAPWTPGRRTPPR